MIGAGLSCCSASCARAVEVQIGAARGRPLLTLVSRTRLCSAVRVLGCALDYSPA